MVLVVTIPTAAFGAYAVWMLRGDRTTQTFGFWAKHTTRLVEALSVATDRRNRLFAVRKLKFNYEGKPQLSSHTHPGNAGIRAASSKFMDEVAAALGLRSYDISVSPRETARGIPGARLFRTPKDLLVEVKYDSLQRGDLVRMVDTDCHLSQSELMSYAGHDLVLYTLRPGSLSGRGPESAWRFITPTIVVEEVKGGASYTHQVWDWGVDMVVLAKGWKTYIYDVVPFPVGEGREVVVLLLAKTVTLPLWFLNILVPGMNELLPRRMAVKKAGRFLVGVFGNPGGKTVQLLDPSIPDVDATVIPTRDFLALETLSKAVCPDVKRAELRASSAESYMRQVKRSYGADHYYTMADYFSTVHTRIEGLTYQSTGPLATEVGEESCFRIAPGLVPPAVCPANTLNNNVRALEERVMATVNVTAFPEDVIPLAKEFVEMVTCRAPGSVAPWSPEEVARKQSRPAQVARRKADRNNLALKTASLKTEAFMKQEAGPSVSDPRIINQVPVHHTTELSRYAYPAAGYLKRFHGRWYAPGKDPIGVAKCLRNFFQHKAGDGPAVGGDYSRMDGRTSVDYRVHVVEPVLLGLVADEHKEALRELLEREREVVVSSRKAKKSTKTKGANVSGSAITTLVNTLNAAFNEYAARRLAGEPKDVAFQRLGVYFGDDSVFDGVIKDQVVELAARLGMKMTIEPVPAESAVGRIVFLARVYPDITKSLNSYASVVRALSKLQVSTHPAARDEEGRMAMRALKGEARMRVDGHVPLIGPYAQYLQKTVSVPQSIRGKLLTRDRELAWDLQREEVSVVLDAMEKDLFLSSIGRDLGISAGEVAQLDAAMRLATSDEHLTSVRLEGWEKEKPVWASWVN